MSRVFRGLNEASNRAHFDAFPCNDGASSNTQREAPTMNDAIRVASPLVILRLSDVKARTGLARSTIYDRIKTGSFPAQVSLGARAVGWLESDIEAWISGQVKRSRAG